MHLFSESRRLVRDGSKSFGFSPPSRHSEPSSGIKSVRFAPVIALQVRPVASFRRVLGPNKGGTA